MTFDREESEMLIKMVNMGLRAIRTQFSGHKLTVAINVATKLNDTYAELFNQIGEKNGIPNQQTGTNLGNHNAVVDSVGDDTNPGVCD